MANWFYYNKKGEKIAVTGEQLKGLASTGMITPETFVETHDGRTGLAKHVNGLTFPVPVTPSPFVKTVQTVSPTTPSPMPASDAIRKINSYFTWFWVCMLLSIPTCGLAMIPSIIFSFMLHYQLWKVVPSDIARTTPGRAVGLCFIPIFHLYWLFVTCLGLSKDINATLRRRGIKHRVSEGLALTYCIFYLMNVVVGFVIPESDIIMNIAFGLFFVLLMAILIYFYKSVKNGAIVLLGELPQGFSESTVKQHVGSRGSSSAREKCGGIGGLFIVIGIILFLVGGNMEGHNRSLLADLDLAESEKQHAIWQSQQDYNVTLDQKIEAIEDIQGASRAAMLAELNLRDSAYSPDLILLLRGLGGFLLLFGFVLIVVGWIIPEKVEYGQ